MIELKNVQGAVEQAVPIMVGKDTVYVHTNIRQEEVEDMQGKRLAWVYDEAQYSMQEYLQKLADDNDEMRGAVEDLVQLLVDKEVIY